MVFVLAACSDKEPETSKDVVGSIVNDEFTIEEDEGKVVVTIDAEGAHEGSKQTLLNDSAEILAGLDKLGTTAATINWNAPITDQYGNERMDSILSIMFDADTFAKVDWSNYAKMDLEAIAYGYKQHEALK